MSPISAEDLAQWQAHIGRTERLEQVLDIESLRRFAVACGMTVDVESIRPPLGHWAWFLPVAPDSQIGADGHPKRGGFLPAVSLPRRMFAGATIQFDAPLAIGEAAQLQMTVMSLNHKSGRTGDLIFVEVERRISQAGRVCVRELQTIVYREGDSPTTLPSVAAGVGTGDWQPGAVNLFRFSAVTFNSHRIHYDAAYATREEGYPALVVHGPFTAAKLAELAQRQFGRPLASFQFKGLAPLFADQPIRLRGDAGSGTFEAIRCDGTTAMTARAT